MDKIWFSISTCSKATSRSTGEDQARRNHIKTLLIVREKATRSLGDRRISSLTGNYHPKEVLTCPQTRPERLKITARMCRSLVRAAPWTQPLRLYTKEPIRWCKEVWIKTTTLRRTQGSKHQSLKGINSKIIKVKITRASLTSQETMPIHRTGWLEWHHPNRHCSVQTERRAQFLQAWMEEQALISNQPPILRNNLNLKETSFQLQPGMTLQTRSSLVTIYNNNRCTGLQSWKERRATATIKAQ